MSLFLCSKCGSVNNTVLETDKCKKGYPCMELMDMHGCGHTHVDISKIDDEFIIKEPHQILMLCDRCNTGYGEYTEPDDEDILISKLSKYNCITLFDHPTGSIVNENGIYKLTKLGKDLILTKYKLSFIKILDIINTLTLEEQNIINEILSIDIKKLDNESKLKNFMEKLFKEDCDKYIELNLKFIVIDEHRKYNKYIKKHNIKKGSK